MVLKKKVDNRSIGFQVSIIPRAPRSARRWGLGRKTGNDHVCAIELLASLAGKLLQETESSASNHASEEDSQLTHFKDVFVEKTLSKDKAPKVELLGSCEGSALVSGEDSKKKDPLRISPEVESNNHWECNSTFVGFPHSHLENEKRDVKITSEISNKIESFLKSKVSDSEKQLSGDHLEDGGIAMVQNFSCLEQSAEKSDRVAAVPSPNFQRQKPFSIWQKNDAKSSLWDENYSTFSKSSTKYRRHPRRALDRKVRKLLASKHWKVAPQLKNYECLENDGARKSLHQRRRISYKRERYHQDFLSKRRKLLDGGLVMTSFLNREIPNSSDPKEKNYLLGSSFKKKCGEMSISSSVFGSQASFNAKNAQVRFSIKSFRIPELLIDVPETATVGSLKRTIVESVSAILGGGLHVGVLLHGKKVGDDNRTLHQSGISCEENLDSLGFMLEPNLTQFRASEHSTLLESSSAPEIVTSRARRNTAETMVVSDFPSNNPSSNVCKKHEEQELPPMQASESGDFLPTEKPTTDSQVLVRVAADTTHHLPLPLAIIPVTQKKNRLELSQRRIRRPFSVPEVEALVEAVEQLGTGRWRDVKLRTFENVDHRTYVDLKDKWKTLVHTASISPQQRRGEPVPQELLDRVMSAHSYWSQHQSKQQQQGKRLQPSETLRIADVPPTLSALTNEESE